MLKSLSLSRTMCITEKQQYVKQCTDLSVEMVPVLMFLYTLWAHERRETNTLHALTAEAAGDETPKNQKSTCGRTLTPQWAVDSTARELVGFLLSKLTSAGSKYTDNFTQNSAAGTLQLQVHGHIY